LRGQDNSVWRARRVNAGHLALHGLKQASEGRQSINNC